MEEVHFAGSPLDQYLQEVASDLRCTVEAPRASFREPEVKSSQARPSRWAQVAKELATICEEACLLSPELADTFDGGVQSDGWWQMPLNVSLSFALVALLRRRNGSLTWCASAVLCLGASCFQSAFHVSRSLVLWEAKATCRALLELFGRSDEAVQLLRTLELEAELAGDLRLSSLLADFSAAAEAQVCALCQRLGASLVPGGHGAARLRLAFARAWQLQEASLLAALRSCAEGQAVCQQLRHLRSSAREASRCLSRELVYAESRKAILSTQRGAVEEVGGLNARVSLSLAMATFSQAMKKRKEVLHSPEAYNSWLQELIGHLESHLEDLSRQTPPKLCEGAGSGWVAPLEPMAKPSTEEELLQAAGYTVLHEALGKRAPEGTVASGLSQEDELRLRRESQSAWRSCVEELQGKLEVRSGAARRWQQRQQSAAKVARVCQELEAQGDLPETGGDERPMRRRPTEAHTELMKALSLKLEGQGEVEDVLEG